MILLVRPEQTRASGRGLTGAFGGQRHPGAPPDNCLLFESEFTLGLIELGHDDLADNCQ